MPRPHHRKRYRNDIDSIAEKYCDTAQPRCEYFGRCGGCLFQNIAYENQCRIKAEYLNNLFRDIPAMEKYIDAIVVQGADPYGYRNRMDFVAAFGMKGLRERGFFKRVVDISRCELMNERCNTVFSGIREILSSVEDYNYLTHEGYLRYVVIRSGFFSGEVMANLILSREEAPSDDLLEQIASRVDSISLLYHSGFADINFGSVYRAIKKGYIEERFGDISYRIRPNTFFQANSAMSVKMYDRIREEAQGNVLDLFSGVGSISLYAAKQADRITGVEIVEESVISARENAERNAITNAEFIACDALEYVKENKGNYDTVILDPPRTGAHPKVIKAIEEMAPPRLVYMSCNPVTFKDNLLLLPSYEVMSFEAHDMFPQTPHVETLAVLKRKDAAINN
jgi:23S rRNA (uracil-5-)-methyltransferase RumA